MINGMKLLHSISIFACSTAVTWYAVHGQWQCALGWLVAFIFATSSAFAYDLADFWRGAYRKAFGVDEEGVE